MTRSKTYPLASYSALDLTDEKGFLCGKMLADLGVDVIKIEKPGGDAARNIGPFYHNIPDSEKSLHWLALNASKRGITLDIKSSTGKDIFKELVKKSDFVIESFSPNYMDDIGLGYSVLNEINPRIIVTSILLFGETGPYRDYAATDFTTMSSGGFIFPTGDSDRPPVMMNAPQAYFHAGAQAAAGTMISHYSRSRTGKGQRVTVSAQASVSCFQPFFRYLWEFVHQIAERNSKLRVGSGVYFRTVWPCKDGYIAYRIFTGATTHSRRVYPLVECLKDEGLADDLESVVWEEMDTMIIKQEQVDHWEKVVSRFFMSHTKKELFDLAQRYGFMFLLPVNTTADILEDPQLAASNYFVQLDYPELGVKLTHPGPYYKSTASLVGPRNRAPRIGEHNMDIYGELGFSEQQIVGLKQAGII